MQPQNALKDKNGFKLDNPVGNSPKTPSTPTSIISRSSKASSQSPCNGTISNNTANSGNEISPGSKLSPDDKASPVTAPSFDVKVNPNSPRVQGEGFKKFVWRMKHHKGLFKNGFACKPSSVTEAIEFLRQPAARTPTPQTHDGATHVTPQTGDSYWGAGAS